MATIISKNQRYLPHTLETKFHAVKTYRSGQSIAFVCRRYKISKASLMRWNERFDGTRDSLRDKSHRPHKPHPNAHTTEELCWIQNFIRRNPHISMIELYAKLLFKKIYKRHPCSLFRVLRKLGYFKSQKKVAKPHINKPYDTPEKIGIKWQLDVKFIPKHCDVSGNTERLYQYTVIDEASRERFIYPYTEHNSYTTVQFIKKAIAYFKYKPKIIQTDNGAEFTHLRETNRTHLFDEFCIKNGIKHQLIRPRTPRHNGKVERSHRNDNERFYSWLKFYSFEDLVKQMERYLYKSNRLPMQVLGWLTPIQKRKQLLSND